MDRKDKKRRNVVLSADTKILLVEENMVFRIWLTGSLLTLGFQTLTSVTNGVKPFDMIENAIEENKPFDIVIAELVVLEGGTIDGLSLFEAVNKMKKSKKPIMLATIESYNDSVMGSLKTLGISHFLSRNFDHSEVKELLYKTLRS